MELFRLIEEEKKAVLAREAAEGIAARFVEIAKKEGGKPEDYTCCVGQVCSYQQALRLIANANERIAIARKNIKREFLAILAE